MTRVVTERTNGAARMSVDFRSASDGAVKSTINAIGQPRSVRVDVGNGIDPENLAKLSLVARQIRDAEVVELVGATELAVSDAQALLILVWTTAEHG
jgi:hypothetical protein